MKLIMSEFDPAPSDEALEQQRKRWVETRDTHQRIKDIIVGIRQPAPIAQIAEQAQCSKNAARKHLTELADLGVAQKETASQRTRYSRNDEYFRWHQANELAATNSAEELFDRLQTLEVVDEEFQERYGVSTPDAVPFPKDADHETIHERWEAIGEWTTIRRDTVIYRDSIRIVRCQR
jgi:predicted ArsR family transcriptional regulator